MTALEGSVIHGDFPSPVAVLSKFGWLLSSPFNVQGNNHLSINLISTHESFVVTQDAIPKEDLSKFWNYETLGIKGEQPTLYDSFADQVKFENGIYKVIFTTQGSTRGRR